MKKKPVPKKFIKVLCEKLEITPGQLTQRVNKVLACYDKKLDRQRFHRLYHRQVVSDYDEMVWAMWQASGMKAKSFLQLCEPEPEPE